METIFIIHSIDDFEHDARQAIKQISRVLKPGGKLVFTSFSSHFKTASPFTKLLAAMRLDSMKSAFFDFYYLGVNYRNLLSREQWRILLDEFDIDLESYREFVPSSYFLFFDVPARIESILMNIVGIHRPFYLVSLLFPRFYKDFIDRLIGTIYMESNKNCKFHKKGVNAFIVAKKKNFKESTSSLDDPEWSLHSAFICPRCAAALCVAVNLENNSRIIKNVICCKCNIQYPVIKGIPLLFRDVTTITVKSASGYK